MDIKAVVTDLDGTLCDDREIHAEDKKAVEDVLARGIPVIIATTRMRFSSARILKDLDIDGSPLICNNGARVIGPGWKNSASYDEWWEAFLDGEVAKKLALYTDERNYEITTIFKEKKFWNSKKYRKHGESYNITEIVDKTQKALENGSPLSFMMHIENNGHDKLRDFESYASNFSGKVNLDRHHRDGELAALTVYPAGVSKKNALEMVANRLDISMNNILAIGDDEVDDRLLKSAGMGVAMGNSPDHVKESADTVAPSCTKNGVAWTLERYILDS